MFNQLDKLTECAHIYRIVFPNGKCYIGQSWDIKKRIKNYERIECKRQIKLDRAYKKYGVDSTEFYILDMCYTQEELDDAEIYWISFYDCIKNGYNIREGGSKGKHSEESKKKNRIAHLGKKYSDEHKKRISEARKGKIHSEESKKKCREAKCKFTYKITTPLNEEVIVKNLNQYCKDNDLDQATMTNVANGKWKTHKRYKVEKL